MKSIHAVFALSAVSFVVGVFFNSDREVAAIIPAPCPKWQCIELEAWWEPGATVKSARDAATGLPSKDGWSEAFAPGASFGQSPFVAGILIKWNTYDYCIPKCGKDPQGVWQAMQEVTPVGTATFQGPARIQDLCTATENNLPGPIIDPENDNPNEEVPPTPPIPTPGDQ